MSYQNSKNSEKPSSDFEINKQCHRQGFDVDKILQLNLPIKIFSI